MDETLKSIDKAIALICEEMDGRNTKTVIALAKVLRDLVIVRAVLHDEKNTVIKALRDF